MAACAAAIPNVLSSSSSSKNCRQLSVCSYLGHKDTRTHCELLSLFSLSFSAPNIPLIFFFFFFFFFFVIVDPKTTDDILSTLPPIRIPSSRNSSSPTALLLLLTPSFAPWLDASRHFVERLVNKLSPNPSCFLQVVTAIVDRLPQLEQEDEGISFLLSPHVTVRGKAAESRQWRRRSSIGVQESVLALSIQTATTNHAIGLRLANTTFINGKEHTLLGTCWPAAAGTTERIVDLTKCLVRLATVGSVHGTGRFPLYPVSRSRKVISCMGNILRQLSADEDGTIMPASFELESELPRYISAHDIDDQRVSVWALLETRGGGAATPEPSNANESDNNVRISESLRSGGKLLRVMSGGGGWGKKQGLLSLDPETDFLSSDHDADSHPLLELNDLVCGGIDKHPSFESDDDDQLPSLSNLVEPGDYVQFFVSVEPADHEFSVKEDGDAASFCFGVLSDKKEEEEEEEKVVNAMDQDMYQKKDLIALPRHFGALSEKAITYSSQSVATGTTSSTKIDVPGSRVKLAIRI